MSIVPDKKHIQGFMITNPLKGQVLGVGLILAGVLLIPVIVGFKILSVGREIYYRSTAWYGPKFLENKIPEPEDKIKEMEKEEITEIVKSIENQFQSGNRLERDEYERYIHLKYYLTKIEYPNATISEKIVKGKVIIDNYLSYGKGHFAVQAFDTFFTPIIQEDIKQNSSKIYPIITIRQALLLAIMHYDYEAREVLKKSLQAIKRIENNEIDQTSLQKEEISEVSAMREAILQQLYNLYSFTGRVLDLDPRKVNRLNFVFEHYGELIQSSRISKKLEIDFDE